ncbi:MAG: N-(5'-phosphoribosyl)anthranilate isomerase [Pseudomonadota bacterium]
MTHHILPPILSAVIPVFTPDQWLYHLFSPLAVAQGTPLKCSLQDVDAHIGRTRFLAEAALRGYHVTEKANGFVLSLQRSPIHLVV